MTIARYESDEAREFRGQNAVDDMHLCLSSLNVSLILRSQSDEEIAQDYAHYRDVAIKYGADISGYPRRIKIPTKAK